MTKTKYILHGGMAKKPNEENDAYFAEMLKDVPSSPKVLLVHFASEPEKSDYDKAKEVAQFDRVREDKEITYEVADENTFEEQIKNADIIYLAGGTTPRLLDTLSKFSNLKELFKSKTVAGESAGANVLATYCYSKSGGGVMKTLGILPIKTIPHYSDVFKNALDELNKHNEDLEMVLLKEFEHRVFEI